LTRIRDALREAVATLEGGESPRLDAEVLLARVLGADRAHVRAWPEREISEEQAGQFYRLIHRRRLGEPVAYLVGVREFRSRMFRVTLDVLIPRPETELLVELALERLPADRPCRILDLGTGSGAIAITLALELPLSRVLAVDASTAALVVARNNAEILGARNVDFLLSDWCEAIEPAPRFDLIAANPPYVAEADPHLAQGDVRFEPRQALISGVDGLDDIRRIANQAQSRLKPGGHLLLEHGYGQARGAEEILSAGGYESICRHADLARVDRCASAVRRQSVGLRAAPTVEAE
jgi:release factor glutamine methyltransferase